MVTVNVVEAEDARKQPARLIHPWVECSSLTHCACTLIGMDFVEWVYLCSVGVKEDPETRPDIWCCRLK